jgi:putative transposase
MAHRPTVRHFHEPGFDRNLFSPDAISSSLAYIHNNPVSRGRCRRAVDRKWSSARYYLGQPPHQQWPGPPRIAGVPEGALD